MATALAASRITNADQSECSASLSANSTAVLRRSFNPVSLSSQRAVSLAAKRLAKPNSNPPTGSAKPTMPAQSREACGIGASFNMTNVTSHRQTPVSNPHHMPRQPS